MSVWVAQLVSPLNTGFLHKTGHRNSKDIGGSACRVTELFSKLFILLSLDRMVMFLSNTFDNFIVASAYHATKLSVSLQNCVVETQPGHALYVSFLLFFSTALFPYLPLPAVWTTLWSLRTQHRGETWMMLIPHPLWAPLDHPVEDTSPRVVTTLVNSVRVPTGLLCPPLCKALTLLWLLSETWPWSSVTQDPRTFRQLGGLIILFFLELIKTAIVDIFPNCECPVWLILAGRATLDFETVFWYRYMQQHMDNVTVASSSFHRVWSLDYRSVISDKEICWIYYGYLLLISAASSCPAFVLLVSPSVPSFNVTSDEGCKGFYGLFLFFSSLAAVKIE